MAADPVTHAELIADLNATHDDVSTYFGALDPQAFTAGSDERWSPAHHLDHLTRATTPVAAGLGISLHLLAPREPGVASRSYAEVRAAYLAALAGGQKAFGRYLPSPDGDQTAIVARYTDAMNTLLENLAPWSDADLDACSMPHPVLGTISVREMLHFTHYHNHHHLCGVQTGVGPAARGSP